METKTEIPAGVTLEPGTKIEPGGLSLVKPLADPSLVVWSPERVQLLKRQCVPAGCTDDEFSVFLLQCKRTELDPVINEAFCVPRRTNIGSKDHPKWIVRHVFQPAVAGMAARADRFPDYGGLRGATIYDKDEISFDEASQTVKHISNPLTRGAPVGAWAQVIRHGRATPISFVKMADYNQGTAQWQSKGPTMIFKCAKAAAYREAYPNCYGGLHVEEELPPEEREVNEAPVARTESVKEQLAGIVAQQRAANGEQPPAPGGQTVNAPAPDTKKTGKKAARKPGTYHDKPIAEMDGNALAEATEKSQKWIEENPMKPEAPSVRALLEELLEEREKRIRLVDPPAPSREPGADDDSDAPF